MPDQLATAGCRHGKSLTGLNCCATYHPPHHSSSDHISQAGRNPSIHILSVPTGSMSYGSKQDAHVQLKWVQKDLPLGGYFFIPESGDNCSTPLSLVTLCVWLTPEWELTLKKKKRGVGGGHKLHDHLRLHVLQTGSHYLASKAMHHFHWPCGKLKTSNPTPRPEHEQKNYTILIQRVTGGDIVHFLLCYSKCVRFRRIRQPAGRVSFLGACLSVTALV